MLTQPSLLHSGVADWQQSARNFLWMQLFCNQHAVDSILPRAGAAGMDECWEYHSCTANSCTMSGSESVSVGERHGASVEKGLCRPCRLVLCR